VVNMNASNEDGEYEGDGCDAEHNRKVNQSFLQPMRFDPAGFEQGFVEVEKPQCDGHDEKDYVRDGVGKVQG
jgi:hypothetical protein